MNETVKDKVLSDENIYLAIYLVDSYIQNKELLLPEERQLILGLRDIFNIDKIQPIINDVKKRLEKIMDNDNEFFHINVFFKPKKYRDGPVFRPLHTSALIDQIAMVAMLQILVYDIGDNGGLISSELSRLIPSNFYGNRISYSNRQLFKPWQEQYQEYTSKANDLLNNYCETYEYKYEVSLDLENFFPSINPKILYNYILKKLPLKLSPQDRATFEIIIRKLLFFFFF